MQEKNGLIPPKEDFYNELKELLKDNAKWVEQVKMSLELLAHLYDSFLKIENKYDTSLKECEKIALEVKEKYAQITALSVKIGEDFLEFSQQTRGLLESMSLKESAVLQALEKVEHLAHEMEVYFTEIENFKVKLELFKEEMAEFNDTFNAQKSEVLQSIEDFKREFAQDKIRLEKMINDASADLTGFRTQILLEKTELEGLAGRHFGELYAHIFNIEKLLMEKGVVSLEQ
ncbi:hypothetical protein [Campylobacter upsaliensis]|uniref:hypothetical protein n=1 Tax=Campylobacter upsaliensis TaxID=28080 RepID=UPI0022EA365D|nr:hypothetical protein [Campylobacter upsaliensis]